MIFSLEIVAHVWKILPVQKTENKCGGLAMEFSYDLNFPELLNLGFCVLANIPHFTTVNHGKCRKIKFSFSLCLG